MKTTQPTAAAALRDLVKLWDLQVECHPDAGPEPYIWSWELERKIIRAEAPDLVDYLVAEHDPTE